MKLLKVESSKNAAQFKTLEAAIGIISECLKTIVQHLVVVRAKDS